MKDTTPRLELDFLRVFSRENIKDENEIANGEQKTIIIRNYRKRIELN